MNSLVAEKVSTRGHQERAKLPFLRRNGRQGSGLDQDGKESLRQIGRSIRVVPLAPDERIDGVPVRLAERRKRLAGLRRGGLLGLLDAHPDRRGEFLGWRRTVGTLRG